MQRILGRLLLLLTIAVQLAAAQETPTEVNEEAAQEAEIDALDPRSSSRDLTAQREALEPAVPTAVLAQDVRRRAGNNGVMDEIDLGRTEITGNQELPKVLYIVPWQKSDPGDLTGKPVNTLLDEVLAPIDRSEFIRQVEYYGDLYGKDEE
jgi:hypothetical protein